MGIRSEIGEMSHDDQMKLLEKLNNQRDADQALEKKVVRKKPKVKAVRRSKK